VDNDRTGEAPSAASQAGNAQAGVSVRAVPPTRKRPTLRDVLEQERAAEAARGGLDRVRKTADNWRLGMAGLVTLTTATLLFKGRSAIQDYVEWARWVMGGLVLISLVAGIVSVLLFLRAAYGHPKVMRAADIANAGGFDAYNLSLAQSALADLVHARRWAIGSLILLALGIGVSWYAPAATKEPIAFVNVTYSYGNGQLSKCGTLKTVDAKGVQLQVEGEEQVSNIPASQLISLALVSQC
jgi:hypothetical protein